MHNDLLASLTEPQRAAVQHVEGPLLILAGPGSGKTRVVTHRIANLMRQGIPARQIVALTFTNKAADEMKARVAQLAPGAAVWASTFHRFCARLLRQYARYVGLPENYTIFDTGDSAKVLRLALDNLRVDAMRFTPERIASRISWAKNNLITSVEYTPQTANPIDSLLTRIYPAYQQQLLAAGGVDFDDLLLHIATLLRDHPEIRADLDDRFRYLLVDEYQDTNLAQYAIIRALSIDHPNVSVTGDPDQSIYGWRGASLRNILEFERDFPQVRVVKLEQNYRSTKRILHVADTLIAHNQRRKHKELFTDNPEGEPVRMVTYMSQRHEAEAIASRIAEEVHSGRRRPRDFAIFYRVNALSRAFEFAFREHGIPYQMVNALEFYQRKEIKDVVAYLQLVNNPLNSVAFLRVINVPARGIGKATLDRLTTAAHQLGISLMDAARHPEFLASLSKRPRGALQQFVEFFDRLSQFAAAPVEEILGHVLAESGYRELYSNSELEEDQQRLANIEELLTAAREFDERHPGPGALEAFLEDVCLANDTDAWEADDDRVTMMTLHAAKGLEFPVVFIIAVEQGLLPHERSANDPEQLEEERRLLFVGLTRAREELVLSRAHYREFRGQRRMSVPSSFLLELPREEMNMEEAFLAAPWTDDPYASDHADDPHSDSEFISDEDDLDGDTSFDPSSFAETSPAVETETASAEPRGARSITQLLATGAELAGENTAPRLPAVSPDVFCLDMVVRHPEYGLGKIIALSGEGQRRSATIRFASGAGERKFVLSKSPLRPAKSSS